MIETILGALANFAINVIKSTGYFGVTGLMAIESANIPLPSEVIMPFSGYLVSQGILNLWWVAVAGAFGCVIGSVLSYALGFWGGRPLVEKYGKYIFLSHHDIDKADKWFAKYGDWAIFISRLLPVVRTFISFPAGLTKMHFKRFVIFTFLGSLPWCIGLAYVGEIMGNNWESLRVYFKRFDVLIAAVIVAVIAWYIWRHIKRK